jgi:hypothetical protein
MSQGSNLPKQLIKDLRVRVERLSSDGNTEMQTANDGTDNKEYILKTIAENEERQVPHLPVAEDEPARGITSSCPLSLKKEGSQEDMVTSSCQEPRSKCVLVQTEQIQTDGLPVKVNLYEIFGTFKHILFNCFSTVNVYSQIKRERRTSEQPTTTALEKLRRELELEKCRELERLQAEHAKELRQLTDRHQQIVSDIKKKQWVIFVFSFASFFKIYSIKHIMHIICCSVIIAKLKRYIIVAGILHIAVQIANKFIGNVSIKGCVGVSVNSCSQMQ